MTQPEKKLLFSVTKDEFRFDTFRAGGKGGQKQNKTESGVRCVHVKSGATGEGRDTRSQPQNRRNAFRRCVESKDFQTWLKNEIVRRRPSETQTVPALTGPTPEQIVQEALRSENLLEEFFENGEWKTTPSTPTAEPTSGDSKTGN